MESRERHHHRGVGSGKNSAEGVVWLLGEAHEREGRAPWLSALGRMMEGAGEECTSVFLSDGSTAFPRGSPCPPENTEKPRSPLVASGVLFATRGSSCISREGLWARRPRLLAH